MASINGINGFNSHRSTPDRNTGSVAEPESELAALSRRHNQFQQFDLEKNKFYDVSDGDTFEATWISVLTVFRSS